MSVQLDLIQSFQNITLTESAESKRGGRVQKERRQYRTKKPYETGPPLRTRQLPKTSDQWPRAGLSGPLIRQGFTHRSSPAFSVSGNQDPLSSSASDRANRAFRDCQSAHISPWVVPSSLNSDLTSAGLDGGNKSKDHF